MPNRRGWTFERARRDNAWLESLVRRAGDAGKQYYLAKPRMPGRGVLAVSEVGIEICTLWRNLVDACLG